MTILLNILAKVGDKQGSKMIFIAILYIVRFFKEVTPKHDYILREYISKRFKNSQTYHVYVKLLY